VTGSALETFESNRLRGAPPAFTLGKIIGVYSMTCKANGRVYAGSSGDCYQRLCWHLAKLRVGKHANRHVQSDYAKYGEDQFEFCIVTRHDSVKSARAAEQEYIGTLRTQGQPYNIARGGKYRPSKACHEYTSTLRGTADVDRATSLQSWMSDNGRDVADLVQALGIDRMRAYRLVAGALPHVAEMRGICDWTRGEIDANEIYGLKMVPYAARRRAAA
jgi:predicted GIY-YIG superfamily endonuclease